MTPRNEKDPKVFEPYWNDYVAFLDTGVRLAPSAIRRDWAVYRANGAKVTAVIKKYGYDQGRFDKDATPAEKATVESPGARYEKAFKNILRFEALVCSSGQPPDADVKFTGDKSSAYCDLIRKDAANSEKLHDSGFDPAVVKAMYLDPEASKLDEELAASAPKVIRADVRAEVNWWRHQQKAVVVKYGYDFRRVLLDGSAKEREALQLTDKRIRDQYARATAYEHQVCGS